MPPGPGQPGWGLVGGRLCWAPLLLGWGRREPGAEVPGSLVSPARPSSSRSPRHSEVGVRAARAVPGQEFRNHHLPVGRAHGRPHALCGAQPGAGEPRTPAPLPRGWGPPGRRQSLRPVLSPPPAQFFWGKTHRVVTFRTALGGQGAGTWQDKESLPGPPTGLHHSPRTRRLGMRCATAPPGGRMVECRLELVLELMFRPHLTLRPVSPSRLGLSQCGRGPHPIPAWPPPAPWPPALLRVPAWQTPALPRRSPSLASLPGDLAQVPSVPSPVMWPRDSGPHTGL